MRTKVKILQHNRWKRFYFSKTLKANKKNCTNISEGPIKTLDGQYWKHRISYIQKTVFKEQTRQIYLRDFWSEDEGGMAGLRMMSDDEGIRTL